MHVPDGFLDAPTSIGTGVVAAMAVGVALRGARRELDDRTAPLTGLVAAFVFATQMLNFPVAAGTSGHLLGGALAAILVGPYTGLLCMSVVFLVQALLFADGGITALGHEHRPDGPGHRGHGMGRLPAPAEGAAQAARHGRAVRWDRRARVGPGGGPRVRRALRDRRHRRGPAGQPRVRHGGRARRGGRRRGDHHRPWRSGASSPCAPTSCTAPVGFSNGASSWSAPPTVRERPHEGRTPAHNPSGSHRHPRRRPWSSPDWSATTPPAVRTGSTAWPRTRDSPRRRRTTRTPTTRLPATTRRASATTGCPGGWPVWSAFSSSSPWPAASSSPCDVDGPRGRRASAPVRRPA